MSVSVSVLGIGVFGPGMTGWSQARSVLAGDHPFQLATLALPAPEALPPAERRRVGLALKLSMAAGFDAVRQSGLDAQSLAAVFSSTGGDCDNCHQMLSTLASSDRSLSPTRFHNSVHNMPAGYWSIATGSMHASTSLCAYDATFAAGLLEAVTQVQSSAQSCLLVAYDTAYPAPLGLLRRVEHAFGVAMVLSPATANTESCATLTLKLCHQLVDVMPDALLERIRLGAPAGRCLPLLQKIAQQQTGKVVLSYLDDLQLAVDVSYGD